MLNWLKKFEETSLGMLFTDQHLSPTEIIRIAKEARTAQSEQYRSESRGIGRRKPCTDARCSSIQA